MMHEHELHWWILVTDTWIVVLTVNDIDGPCAKFQSSDAVVLSRFVATQIKKLNCPYDSSTLPEFDGSLMVCHSFFSFCEKAVTGIAWQLPWFNPWIVPPRPRENKHRMMGLHGRLACYSHCLFIDLHNKEALSLSLWAISSLSGQHLPINLCLDTHTAFQRNAHRFRETVICTDIPRFACSYA